MQTIIRVLGQERQLHNKLAKLIVNCKKHLLSDHLDIYCDVFFTPEGEMHTFDARLDEREGKLPTVIISINEDSVWLQKDESND